MQTNPIGCRLASAESDGSLQRVLDHTGVKLW
jgi:hypothetical protein